MPPKKQYKPKPIKFEYVEPIFDPNEKYGHYNALTEYQRKCIHATNYWRIANGKEPIDVPKDNIEYWSNWTEKTINEAKLIYSNKAKLQRL